MNKEQTRKPFSNAKPSNQPISLQTEAKKLIEAYLGSTDATNLYDGMKARFGELVFEVISKDKTKLVEGQVPNKAVFSVMVQGLKYTITVNRAHEINYDIDAMRKKIDKEYHNEVFNTKYEVADMDKLKKLMKDAGISAKEFSSCFKTTRTVNQTNLMKLVNDKEITFEDFAGTYTVSSDKKSSVRIARGAK